jgi:DNA-binding IclR family transcriptional regulator
MGLLVQARVALDQLVRATRESAFVAIRKGAGVIPLEFVESPRAVRAVSFLGTVLPAHCTAAGKIYLVFESEGEIGRDLAENLKRYTEKTPVDRRGLMEQLNGIGAAGYAVEHGEFIEEVSSVAVPVRDYTRTLVGTLAVAGPSYRVTEERTRQEIVPLILEAGNDLSRRLGFPG